MGDDYGYPKRKARWFACFMTLAQRMIREINSYQNQKEGGLKLVQDFLNEELGEDDLEKKVQTWDKF